MTIHQLSVFIENKPNMLYRVLNILKEANIQIVASTVSDTVEYGIFRFICSDHALAYRLLKNANFNVTLSNAFALVLDSDPGKAAETIKVLTDNNINISYMYSFMLDKRSIMIFRTNDDEKAAEVIMMNDLEFIQGKDLVRLL